jgi:hypothetical protein
VRHLGVQGKNTITGVTQDVVIAEIAEAESFVPPLDALYIATTAKRDAHIQKFVRDLSATRRQGGKFSVGILFWDDIVQDLTRDEGEFFKHYPQIRSSFGADLAKKHDRDLYDGLIRLLSSDGVVGFLDRTNMEGWSFEVKALDPLFEFYYDWNSPEREFINPDLEVLRSQLWSKAKEYLNVIAIETFPVGYGRQSVPEEWEDEQPERFSRVVKALHSLAGEIVKLHTKLVRTGRSYLVGDP